mgnify:CR=1 FL=1
MFFREFKYMLLSSLRSRELIFWTLLFPFALTTFMYMAFGDIFDRTEKFEPVPVAIVKEQDNMTLTAMLNAVSAEGDKKLLITTYTGEKEAKKLLEEDQVKGIIYMGNKLSLTVKESGMDETMLQSVLKQFTKYDSGYGTKTSGQNRAGGKTDAAGNIVFYKGGKYEGKSG